MGIVAIVSVPPVGVVERAEAWMRAAWKRECALRYPTPEAWERRPYAPPEVEADPRYREAGAESVRATDVYLYLCGRDARPAEWTPVRAERGREAWIAMDGPAVRLPKIYATMQRYAARAGVPLEPPSGDARLDAMRLIQLRQWVEILATGYPVPRDRWMDARVDVLAPTRADRTFVEAEGWEPLTATIVCLATIAALAARS